MSSASRHHLPHPRSGGTLKPVVDRLGGLLLLLMGAPLLLIIWMALWLSDDGPVLDHDRRIGLSGRPFSLLRFRTRPWENSRSTTTISGVRRLLRNTHLDELPQIINVVRGDLSLVGPRPLRWSGQPQAWPHGLKPGLIGLRDPGGPSSSEKDELTPERYADEWSLALDLAILRRALRHAARSSGTR
jgi:putative colanic acid biosynthesis UDP-glucose lipid carrier transferase